MTALRNMLIIGGESRNVGKTELICRLIERVSLTTDLITLKISGLDPGNKNKHGSHGPLPEKYQLIEESSRNGIKDSSRMLVAGAGRAFYLRTKDEFLAEAMESFFGVVDRQSVLICESITLRKIFKPGLFVIVKGDREDRTKNSLSEVLPLVDLTFISDGSSFNPDPGIITLNSNGWKIEDH
jgi:hypothetical protein